MDFFFQNSYVGPLLLRKTVSVLDDPTSALIPSCNDPILRSGRYEAVGPTGLYYRVCSVHISYKFSRTEYRRKINCIKHPTEYLQGQMQTSLHQIMNSRNNQHRSKVKYMKYSKISLKSTPHQSMPPIESCPAWNIPAPESKTSPKGQSLLFLLSKTNLRPSSDIAILIHTHISPTRFTQVRNT